MNSGFFKLRLICQIDNTFKFKSAKSMLLICLLFLIALSINAQKGVFEQITGPYIGQKPPGMT
ncbi:MAG TPA: hypothetical protein DDW27_09995, partial [Bacteroidales bacterium]|nr:hypothetical protein [Bacteroidales bacterium]